MRPTCAESGLAFLWRGVAHSHATGAAVTHEPCHDAVPQCRATRAVHRAVVRGGGCGIGAVVLRALFDNAQTCVATAVLYMAWYRPFPLPLFTSPRCREPQSVPSVLSPRRIKQINIISFHSVKNKSIATVNVKRCGTILLRIFRIPRRGVPVRAPACIPSQPPCSDTRGDITTTGPERAEVPVSRVRAQDRGCRRARQRERALLRPRGRVPGAGRSLTACTLTLC